MYRDISGPSPINKIFVYKKNIKHVDDICLLISKSLLRLINFFILSSISLKSNKVLMTSIPGSVDCFLKILKNKPHNVCKQFATRFG